ncbi:MAG: beta/gamma crystallin-related protein, partial [Thermoanaerobaculia bacterium]
GIRWSWNDGEPRRDARDRREQDQDDFGFGVTLFRDRDLNGPSETFSGDVPDLRSTRVGARKASSIRVPRGCVATLYAQPGYRGRSAEFRDDDNNLGNTRVGEDQASSLRVECGTDRDDRRR